MSRFHAVEAKIIFPLVRKAFASAGIPLSLNDKAAILFWYDTLREIDYYSTLKPWQIVNRIPGINNICRKAYLSRLMNRMIAYYPSLYTFYPKTYVLPNDNQKFISAVMMHNKRHIVKPDGGSLGIGITLLSEKDDFSPIESLAIAQEYLPSALINDTKFDLRIFVLIASVSPLTVYVYRDGIARFCSMKSGSDSVFSELTNTAINKKNPNVTMEMITRMTRHVFASVERNQGVDIDLLWRKIDNIILLTIISDLRYIEEGVKKYCPTICYNRCFQILGFDIILDPDWNPHLLEVNFRPSLEGSTDDEKALKIQMLSEALSIAAPIDPIQQLINQSHQMSQKHFEKCFREAKMKASIDQNFQKNLSKVRGFSKIFPTENQNNQKIYEDVMNLVRMMPISQEGKLPCLLKLPKSIPAIGTLEF